MSANKKHTRQNLSRTTKNMFANCTRANCQQHARQQIIQLLRDEIKNICVKNVSTTTINMFANYARANCQQHPRHQILQLLREFMFSQQKCNILIRMQKK